MKLTVIGIKNAQAKAKPYKMSDGLGLYILVTIKGRKCWRFNYRYAGQYKTLALGIFPEVSLKAARQALQTARNCLAEGRDPHAEKQQQKYLQQPHSEQSFQLIALEWLSHQQPIWVDSHYRTVHSRLLKYVFPLIGHRHVAAITAPELLLMLRRIEATGFHETAHRVRSVCGQIFRYAIVTGRLERDPSADIKDALVPVKSGHFASLTDPIKVGGLLRAIDNYSGDINTRCAMQLAALTFVRPTELRHAEWSEIRLSAAEWLIPAAKMKMRNDHIVPLSRQALAVLQTMVSLKRASPYIFPCLRSQQRPMSENTVNAALRRMGYSKTEMTGHGFRATASTLLNEQGVNLDWIETQLAHSDSNKIRAAYNRARYLPQRKIMMQQWADYLECLKQSNPRSKETLCSFT